MIHNLLLYLQYRPWGRQGEPMLVYMLDGSMHHSGLVDRLHQILGIYARCKFHGYKFGLLANHPFPMEDYLLPKYNWKLNEDEISRNIFYARPLYLGLRPEKEYKKLIKLNNRQLHAFAHIYWGTPLELGYTLKELFWELFQPIKEISNTVEEYKQKYKSWSSLHFRFQNLLGDFNEPDHFKGIVLSHEAKNELKNQCYKYVVNESKNCRDIILVCSDSISFLESISDIPGVFTLPGNPIHIDYIDKTEFSSDIMKNFVDFFMISAGESVKSVQSEFLYPSNFPKLAAEISGIAFSRVQL